MIVTGTGASDGPRARAGQHSRRVGVHSESLPATGKPSHRAPEGTRMGPGGKGLASATAWLRGESLASLHGHNLN